MRVRILTSIGKDNALDDYEHVEACNAFKCPSMTARSCF